MRINIALNATIQGIQHSLLKDKGRLITVFKPCFEAIHVVKAFNDVVYLHAPDKAADSVEVAGTASLELEITDGTGFVININKESLTNIP